MAPVTLQSVEPVAQTRPFLGFVSDDVSRATMTKVAQSIGGGMVRPGGLAEAIAELADATTPSILAVDIDGSSDPLADMRRLADVCDPGTRVIALGSLNDVGIYRDFIALGVAEYLVKPISQDDVKGALERGPGTMPPKAPAPSKSGSVIAVIGAHGGVGATAVAVNVAWTLAHQHRRRTALLDLDIYFGAVALALDIEPGQGFREALENPSRVDSLFVERAMAKVAPDLFVLAAEESLTEKAFSFSEDSLRLLFRTLTAEFDCVVIDVPRFVARTQAAWLGADTRFIAVTDRSLQGLRDVMRLAPFVQTAATDGRLNVVLNEPVAPKDRALTAADFEGTQGVNVIGHVPYDPKAMGASLGAGKPLGQVAKGSKSYAALAAIAGAVLPRNETPEAQPSIWQRWLRAK